MLISPLVMAFALGVDPLSGAPALRLWEGEAPAQKGRPDMNVPTVSVFVPKEKPNGTAVVICPGGGYGMLAVGHEGKDVAEWLNARGVTAFVLRYRIVQFDRPGPLHPAPMLDVQRAIRLVRHHAKEYKLDPKRVGVWGFSAGGHLASTAATHFDSGKNDGDEIDKQSCRPDFAVLSYPVITFSGKALHAGSRRALIGDNADEKLIELYSNEKQVTKETPPTFLFHTEEDTGVPPENSRLFATACKKHGVPVEVLIVPKGPHGVGLGTSYPPGIAKTMPDLKKWPEKLEAWMDGRGLLPK
jgi:acetyl esterase/lipase